MLIFIATVLAVAAIGLITIGLHGRRVGDHQHCRRCGYDLLGLPYGTGACPECGADLFEDNARVLGQRHRRVAPLLSGAILLLIAAIPGTIGGLDAAGKIDWYRYKPASWLVRDALKTPPDQNSISELTRRIAAGKFSPGTVAAIVDPLLAVQADESKPWNTDWGKLIEAVHTASLLDPPRWHAYMKQGVQPAVSTRSRVNHDKPFAIQLTSRRPARAGSAPIEARTWYSNPRLDGKPVKLEKNDRVDSKYPLSAGPNGWSSSGWIVVTEPGQLAPGPHYFELDGKTEYRLSQTMGRDTGTPPETTHVTTIRRDFTVNTPGAGDPMTIIDPADRQTMRTCFEFTVSRRPEGLEISTSVQSAPHKLACRVFVRAGTIEFPIGSIMTLSKKVGTGSAERLALPNASELKTVDVIVRPDPPTIDKNPDDELIWGEEIVFTGVPIADLPPAR